MSRRILRHGDNSLHRHSRPTHPLRAHSARSVGGALLLLLLLLVPLLAAFPARGAQAAPTSITGLHVEGNRIVNGSGQVIRLRGVNRSGTEYACIQGWGFFDGPSDAASARAIASWGANAVRVPLNETCWLGINGAPAAYSGANYRQTIQTYVQTLNDAGLVAILDLHWSHYGAGQAREQQDMPNRDHSPAFWRSVATTFKGNSSVVFDLFNEPIPENNRDSVQAWECWRDGGADCTDLGFQAAGMQELVNAVRSTGATNIVMLTGVQWGAGLSRWLEYKPTDATGNTAASWHMYPMSWYADDTNHWNTYVDRVIRGAPLIAGEIGQTNGYCGADFLNKVGDWLDARGASYNAWAWNAWGGCESLIEDYSGTPTQPYGQAYKNRLASGGTTEPPAGDTTAPVASASPRGGTYDAAQSVTLSANESAAIYYTTDGGTPTTASARYSGPISIGSTTTLKFFGRDAAGNASTVSTETYTISSSAADETPPAVKVPVPALVAGTSLGTTNVPVRIGWSASDPSGVPHYHVQEFRNGAYAGDVHLDPLNTTRVVRQLVPGSTYNYSAKAQDGAGNWSWEWHDGPAFRVTAVQSGNSAVAYTGGWKTVARTASYRSYTTYATQAGAKARYTFTGRSFGWIAHTGPTQGKAAVYRVNADGSRTLLRTVDLYSSTAQDRRVVYTETYGAATTRTVEIEVLGTAGRPRVDVDAFITLR